jgi:hypothetical protein
MIVAACASHGLSSSAAAISVMQCTRNRKAKKSVAQRCDGNLKLSVPIMAWRPMASGHRRPNGRVSIRLLTIRMPRGVIFYGYKKRRPV